MEKGDTARPGVRLRHLAIRNYKAIDELELDFPEPELPSDPDVFALGSANGVGKTSVLESCALLLLAHVRNSDLFSFEMDTTVRAGASIATIAGDLAVGTTSDPATLSFGSQGNSFAPSSVLPAFRREDHASRASLDSLFGRSPNVLVLRPLMYFHSYRKVLAGDTSLTALGQGSVASQFKVEVLKCLLAQMGAFENIQVSDADGALNRLNVLMARYLHGRFERPHLSEDAMQLRIRPEDGGPSFAYDGLSSGQKEVIATMFLIWRHTKDNPGVVLIDEPELHLNAEWQLNLVRQLHEIAPWNQYILATHSEDIFASVLPERRFLLQPRKVAVAT